MLLAERNNTGGRVVVAGGVVKSATAPMAVLSIPVVLSESVFTPMAVLSSGGVAKERTTTGGRVVVAGCVAMERNRTVAVLKLPLVLPLSA